jgi:hypothetical protein
MIKIWAPSEFIPVLIHLHLLLGEPATRHHIVVGRVPGCSSQTVGGSEHFKATLVSRIINEIIPVIQWPRLFTTCLCTNPHYQYW